MPEYHTDCRHFRGDRPCRFMRGCEDCPHHDPIQTRILVIKLGATGDVLRTTPLLPALRRAHPGAQLTWVTRPTAFELLRGLEEIDRLLLFDTDALAHLPAERFDLVLCLDKEPAATGLASRVAADLKRGFVLGPDGTLQPAHPDSDYAYRLGLDDDFKFRKNQKTYQQIAFEMAGLEWQGEDYHLVLDERDRAYAQATFAGLEVASDEPLIGLNVGAGDAFANKAWRVGGWAELAGLVSERLGLRCVLLGGAGDRSRMDAVAGRASVPLLDPGVTGSVSRFAAIAERCQAVVSGDTLGLHLALALRRGVVAIFGSTCAQEIELYGRGEKLLPKIDCHPCYKRQCDYDPSCTDAVPSLDVFHALSRVLDRVA